ncbi:DNA damage-inducible transcript 4-like protein isoform X2 [Oryzias latipes]|uniref:DNA damage-inducible transcript 4-like protein isoform X2 n=1 Tax=Oryzias latipes TaxID=8090 RepID=UPI000CE1CEE1|nr:DNA damage-inducible transcript 4-like protein isoform X2 [Oryzias latipes]
MVYSAALPLGNAVPVLSEEVMIGKYFPQLASPGQRLNPSRRGSVESCDERDTTTVPNLEDGLEDELRLVHHDVTRQMERCLTEAKASVLNCQVLLLPRHMIPRVTNDVLRSSVDEPCGLRGASIQLYVEGKDGLKSAGSIFPDPSVTPTFELSVVFRLDKGDGWPPLRHFFDSKVLKLRPEYRLVKRKLYSSASPVVHDFS